MKLIYKRLKTGNYTARNNGSFVFIFKRPHGAWCAVISHDGVGTHSEGYFETSLPDIKTAKDWVSGKMKELKVKE
jgi:hypothetical protein